MVSEYTIDAKNKTIGRIASQAAFFLMGKNTSSFAKNIIPKTKVSIVNASLIKISQSKIQRKEYFRFSGYPGGRKSKTMKKTIAQKGYSEIFRNAVYGMLPKNKLRKPMLKNLKIID